MTSWDKAVSAYGNDGGRAVAKLQEREHDLTHWLRSNHPNIQDEQRQLDEGTTERAYWHYGYLAAVRDVLALLEAK